MASKHFRKRDAILNALQMSRSHPSAETLFNRLKADIPDLSMGTVYRNLNLFKQQGLAICIATVDGVERFDGNTSPHVHFICNDCSAVIDLDAIEVPEALATTAESCCGGQVTGCQLSFTGTCRNCLSKKESA